MYIYAQLGENKCAFEVCMRARQKIIHSQGNTDLRQYRIYLSLNTEFRSAKMLRKTSNEKIDT